MTDGFSAKCSREPVKVPAAHHGLNGADAASLRPGSTPGEATKYSVWIEWQRRAILGGYGGKVARIKQRFGIEGITVNWHSRFPVAEADLPDLRAIEQLGYIRILSLTPANISTL